MIDLKIDQGRKILELLDKTNLKIKSSFWIQWPETNEWKLVFCTDKLNAKGPKYIYREIQKIILGKQNKITSINLSEIVLIDDKHSLNKSKNLCNECFDVNEGG